MFHHPDDPAHTSFNWRGVHFIVVVPLIIGTIARRNGYLADPAHPVRWLSAWMILGVAAVATGRGAIPGQFWTRRYHRSRREFAIGAAFGVVATALGECTRLLWAPLQN